jgi:hypothetical protein
MNLDAISGSGDAAYTITNSTAETTLGVTALAYNAFPAVNLSGSTYPGPIYRFTAYGRVSSDASSPGTLTFKLKYGSTALATATITLPASLSNSAWTIQGIIDFETISTSASSSKVSVNGVVMLQGTSNAALIAGLFAGTGTPAADTATIDTTAGGVLMSLTCTMSSATASNTVTCAKNLFEILE